MFLGFGDQTEDAIKGLGSSITGADAADVINSYASQLLQYTYDHYNDLPQTALSEATNVALAQQQFATTLANSGLTYTRPSDGFNSIISSVGQIMAQLSALGASVNIETAAQAGLWQDVGNGIENAVSSITNPLQDIGNISLFITKYAVPIAAGLGGLFLLYNYKKVQSFLDWK